MTTFNGKKVDFGSYYPAISPSDLNAVGSGKGGNHVLDIHATGKDEGVIIPRVVVSGSSISITYSLADAGIEFYTSGFDGFEFSFKGINNIDGVSVSTNILGMSASKVGFNSHQIAINYAGTELPFDAQAYLTVHVDFGRTHGAALSMSHAIASFADSGAAPLLSAGEIHSATETGMTLAPSHHHH